MSNTGHFFKWIVIFSLLAFLACTQKNPLDSTSSILGNQPNLVNIKAEPDTVAAGGGISVVQVTLLNQKDKPMSGGIVTFSLDGEGTLDTTSAATNSDGVASVNFYSGTKGAQSKVKATYQNSEKEVPITVISASSGQAIILLSSMKKSIYANGIDSTIIQVHMIPDENTTVENQLVTLSSSFGTIAPNGILDNEGKAYVVLYSDTSYVDTQAMVSASCCKMTAMTAVPVKAVTFEISTNQALLQADGKSTCKITGKVKQKSTGIPIMGADLIFSSEAGEIQNQITTEPDGKATVTLTSTPTPDTTVVRGWYGEISDSVTVIFYSSNVSDERSQIVSITPEKPEIWANPTYSDPITVEVVDADGLPKDSATVYFESSAGMLSHTQRLTDKEGKAMVYLSGYDSDFDSTATIKADLYNGTPSAETSVLLKSESYRPRYIEIRFSPPSIGVIETGQISTTNVIASVKDTKYRLVGDNIRVFFDVIEEPGGVKVTAVTDQGVPTVGGEAKITLTAGTRSGVVRMRARLIDDPLTEEDESEIEVESTKLIIHAGPPFMADPNDPSTAHLSIGAKRLNIWANQDTTEITVQLSDKYHNPVDNNTAVYLYSTGGTISTQSFTDVYGIVADTLFSGDAQPTVNRSHGFELNLYTFTQAEFNAGAAIPFHYGILQPVDYGGDYIWNPNYDAENNINNVLQYIPYYLGDYEYSEVPNSNTIHFENTEEWDMGENDGIARILAKTIGMDWKGDSIYVWNWGDVIFSSYVLDNVQTQTGEFLDGFRENSVVKIAERNQPGTSLDYVLRTINSIKQKYERASNIPDMELYQYDLFPSGHGHILFIGESITIDIVIYDLNGNPVHCGARVNASLNSDAPLGLGWTTLINWTGTGHTRYSLEISNAVNPEKPKSGSSSVRIAVDYIGGLVDMSTASFRAEAYSLSEYIDQELWIRYGELELPVE